MDASGRNQTWLRRAPAMISPRRGRRIATAHGFVPRLRGGRRRLGGPV